MQTFLNIYIDQPTPHKHIKRHLLYSIIWLLDISVFLLRIDSPLLKYFKIESNFLLLFIPFCLIVVNYLILVKQKWYFSLAFIFYPILLLFWFIPKVILKNGKLYLFLYYLEVILKYLVKLKKSLLKTAVLFVVILLLSTIDSNYIRIVCVIYFTYIFLKTLYNYGIGSFERTQAPSNKKPSSISNVDLIETIEKAKDDEKLSPEQNASKKIKNMILWNYFLQYFSSNVNSYRGKRAFMIVWLYKYFFVFFLTIFYFTFLNCQLYKIDTSNFITTAIPNIFDFFYYTFKNVTFSNIDSLKPNSVISKIAEMSSFFILSIYFLIITISSILSLKMSKYSKDMEDAVILCRVQHEKIEQHLKVKYNVEVSNAVTEIENIQTSVFKLKSILERIL